MSKPSDMFLAGLVIGFQGSHILIRVVGIIFWSCPTEKEVIVEDAPRLKFGEIECQMI